MLLDKLDNLLIRIVIILLRTHLIIKVRTVERTLELRTILNAQTAHNVSTYLVSSRCSKCNDRRSANRFDGITNLTVLRAEVMSPLRDTMCLINSVEANLHRLKELHILLFVQGLRSHIKQFCATRNNVRTHLIDFGFLQGRVEIMRHTIFLADSIDDVHLVLHQCNERRNDYRRSFHNQ